MKNIIKISAEEMRSLLSASSPANLMIGIVTVCPQLDNVVVLVEVLVHLALLSQSEKIKLLKILD